MKTAGGPENGKRVDEKLEEDLPCLGVSGCVRPLVASKTGPKRNGLVGTV